MQKSAKLRTSSKEQRSLYLKIGLIAVLVLFALWEIVPSIRWFGMSQEDRAAMDPSVRESLRGKSLNLGLDLQGGIHLVMQVDTSEMSGDVANDAVDRAMTVIKNRVDQFGLTEPVVQRVGDNRIIIELPGMSDVERAKNLIGRTARLEFKLLKSDEDIRFITERIDHMLAGVTEPAAAVDTTAAAAADTAVAAADTTAPDIFGEQQAAETGQNPFTSQLQYERTGGEPSFNMLVSNKNVPRIEAYLARPEVQNAVSNARAQFYWGPEDERDDNFRILYLSNEASEMTGDMVQDARVQIGHGLTVSPEIQFETTSDGVREWARITGANVGHRIAIVLDNTVYSAPTVRDKIYTGTSVITGSFTQDEARDLAIVLRAGALPATVNIIEDRTVGPSLGADSIRESRTAFIIGSIAVILFMIAYYFGGGLIAVFALVLDILFILAYLAYFHATLTLPGMAGIVLTIGMAVDANVLIFERIREELRAGNPWRTAVENGFLRSRWTILDSNITTILTAIILYNFGTGPIRGFALTLMVGIIVSVFTALVVSRVIFDLIAMKSTPTAKFMGLFYPLANARFPFITQRRKAYLFSGALILAGFVSLAVHGGPKLSIDFLGGNLLELHFSQPVNVADIRSALGTVNVPGADLATSEIKLVGRDRQDVLIRTVNVGNMTETSQQVKQALRDRFAGSIPENSNEWILREEQVGPSIGSELKTQALWAILFSLVVMVVYLSFRFDFKFSLGALLALAHDVLITIGMFSLFGKEISLVVIAAILTVVGYSVNDTIVVFDRIREKLRTGLKEGYIAVLNNSINETLTRTIITSGTTLLTVVSLFFFGGAVIHDFSFALLVGIGIGTYSSIFVAAPVLVEWYNHVSRKRGSIK